jgi:hypothetical protein
MFDADPGVLFKVVDSEIDCMCGGTCGSCERSDVTLFDLVVRNKTLAEADLFGARRSSEPEGSLRHTWDGHGDDPLKTRESHNP